MWSSSSPGAKTMDQEIQAVTNICTHIPATSTATPKIMQDMNTATRTNMGMSKVPIMIMDARTFTPRSPGTRMRRIVRFRPF